MPHVRRWSLLAGLVGLGCALAAGCLSPLRQAQSPVGDGLSTADLIDPPAQAESDRLTDTIELCRVAGTASLPKAQTVPGPKRTVLALSGGGAYGAYTAGIVAGWTRRGDRPAFDVVTGISTGALIAPLAFLGPRYDADLERVYTTQRNSDLYRVRRVARVILSDSLADNTPLVRQVEDRLTPDMIRAVAAEHAKGRRLYVGTTELDGKRFVVWDVGAIAARGGPDARDLIGRVLVASAAIPGFFPPVKIPVDVDGKRYEEWHVDGGVSAALFFRPPAVAGGARCDPATTPLAGTDVYAVVAGKLYPDPEFVRRRALAIARTSVTTVIDSLGRGDLVRLYTLCRMTGMGYHLAAIPADFPAPDSPTDFDPAAMRRLFDEGVRQVVGGTAWRAAPPGAGPGEAVLARAGTNLTRVPRPPAGAPVVPADSR